MTAETPAAAVSTVSTATSLDGRSFRYRAGGASSLLPGDLVVITTPDGVEILGQVREGGQASSSAEQSGTGTVIGVIGPDDAPLRRQKPAFAAGTVRAPSVTHLVALQRAGGADLPIGTWRSGGAEAEARLRAQGFNRHSFLCGQSGSGKTYALGVILEQLMLGTDLRMVVLDPNADFVRLSEARTDAPAAEAGRIEAMDVRILRPDSAGGQPLRLRFATMPRQAQAAVLQLDPLADRGEYSQFMRMTEDGVPVDIATLVARLAAGTADEQALGQRIENLGLLDWEVWAGEQASAAEVVESGARVTVLDLGGFRHPREPVAVALDLVERLWAKRGSRTATLIVIDEAHNLCPAEPSGPLQTALVERLIQIAAEGRKYGLWLLLSTQRPSKIHPQVLSQCDNLALMRMNSPSDVSDLAKAFGFAPEAMLRTAHDFAQGEVLVAGGFVPVPGFVQMGARLTYEGGSDVSVPQSAPAPAS